MAHLYRETRDRHLPDEGVVEAVQTSKREGEEEAHEETRRALRGQL
jgi:hypothetical protein